MVVGFDKWPKVAMSSLLRESFSRWFRASGLRQTECRLSLHKQQLQVGKWDRPPRLPQSDVLPATPAFVGAPSLKQLSSNTAALDIMSVLH